MKDMLKLILGVLASLFKSRAKLEVEILILRQQINVLRRRAPKRTHLNNTDRFLFVWLYHWFPSVLGAIAIVRPETIIRWHRSGFRAYWRWRSRNHVDGIAAVDLFVLPTIAFRILYCLVIIRHGRRIWLSFGVTENPTAEWISRQITEAFPWDQAPRYLIRDRDTSYGPVFVQRLRAMSIRDRPIAFRSPWQNAYVERLIGPIRRECLDHMIVFGEAHLRRIVGAYAAYYNESRTHRSLNKDAPFHRAIDRLGAIM